MPVTGSERALDSAAGTGALAFALAPLVREVVAIDLVPELLAEGRARAAAFPNVRFVEGDATALPVEDASFDLAATIRSLHHIADPVSYLDLADCEGEARERAIALAPSTPRYTTRLAWYLLRRSA